MKKRFLALFLGLAFSFALAACGGGDLTGEPPSDDEPERSVRYVAFTSDVHYDVKNGSVFDGWMAELQKDVENLDYMAFLGDHGSAYLQTSAFWESSAEFMKMADAYVESGFIHNENVFIFGNHEWYTVAGGDYRNNKDSIAARRLVPAGETVETEWYILYAFGPVDYSEGPHDYGSAQHFTVEEIEKLQAYLETAPDDIPIFVMSHFPIHTYKTTREDRVSGNAGMLVDVLNDYPNVVFLWGHNHSSVDPSYDTVFSSGDTLLVGPSNIGETKSINFTYAAAGCMSDREYRPDIPQVAGKGLLASIDGADVSLKWYGVPEELTPES